MIIKQLTTVIVALLLVSCSTLGGTGSTSIETISRNAKESIYIPPHVDKVMSVIAIAAMIGYSHSKKDD